MTLRLSSIISLLALLAFAAAAAAAQPKVTGPIRITSETLTADNKAHTALFERNVVAKTGDMTMYADSMLVRYSEEGGEVTRIEAAGNVRLQKGGRIITAANATYLAAEDKVVFTGDPRAVDGENVVSGETMTYHITEDRSEVKKSRVVLKNRKGP